MTKVLVIHVVNSPTYHGPDRGKFPNHWKATRVWLKNFTEFSSCDSKRYGKFRRKKEDNTIETKKNKIDNALMTNTEDEISSKRK